MISGASCGDVSHAVSAQRKKNGVRNPSLWPTLMHRLPEISSRVQMPLLP